MAVTQEEVLHIAALARIGVTDEDLEQLQVKLSQVLALFQIMQEIDTTDVPPSGHSESLESVMRQDCSEDSATREVILANAPKLEGELIRVKAVLEE